MEAPPPTPREEERLETLRSLRLLDTEAEERFDRVTRLAKRLFQVPIALVSLVDEDRQWFKSKQGLDADETSREISFCGHAILGDATFVVPDARADERFADNPLVTGDPGIAFYAGRPIAAPDGSPVGTLCVIDRTARDLSREELAVLDDLAVLIERELAATESASLDALTRISNRRGFDLLADKALAHCRRSKHPASLLYIDMDGFKAINDELGHEAGDRALKDMATLLLQTFRESDVIARIGGDEMCVLMMDATPAESSQAVDRLEGAVEQHNAEAGRQYALRFSLGVAAYDPARHESVQALMSEADANMYRQKRSQRTDAEAGDVVDES